MSLRPCLALLLLAPLYASAATYTIEARHTQGVLRWNHLGFANPTAKFSQVEGVVVFDPADLAHASVKATIPLTQLATGVPDLDDDFRSEAFFDYAKFPTATFASTSVKPGAKPDEFTLTGTLDLHGQAHPVTLAVHVNKIGVNVRSGVPSVGFEAHGTLKRSDFGLGKFVPQVSDDIQIDLTVEGAEATAYAAKLKADQAEQDAATAKAEAEKAAAIAAAVAATGGDKPAGAKRTH